MDERSPRQPDSSGPPEDSDGTQAHQSRPENPYRIPQRPPGARPTETGNFGFDRPRPAEPEAPPASGPSTPAEEPREPWGTPVEPRPAQESWNEPTQSQGSQSHESWGTPPAAAAEPQTPQEPWGTPVEPKPAQESWGTPVEPQASQESWGQPSGSKESWNEPAGAQPSPGSWGTPPAAEPQTSPEPWERPAEEPREPWGTPVEPRPAQESWGASAGSQDRWDVPAEPESTQESWGTPPAAAEPQTSPEPWGTPVEPRSAQESWGHPSGSQESWNEPAGAQPSPEQWGAPVEPRPAQESWNDHGAGQQQDWAQAAQGYGQHGYEEQGNQSAGTSPEAWETPYGGQPAYAGDTPYPGSAPEPPAGPAPGEGENRSDSYEFLYSGPGGTASGGQGGPGGPQGPDDPYDDDYDDYDPGPPPPRKKSRRGLIIGVVATVLVLALAGGAAGWYVYTLPQPEEATAEYKAAWEGQDYARLAAVTTGGDAEQTLAGIDTGLGVDGVAVEVGAPTTEGSTGSAPYEVTVSLTNADDWGWEGELPLVREDGEWLVEFSPEVAYPGLGEGQILARTAVWGERGQIQAADGTRLDSPDISGSLQMIVGELGEADEDDVERLGPAYSVGDTIGKSGLQRSYEEQLAGEAATTIVMVDAAEAEDGDSLEATEENTVATLDGSDGEPITTSIDMTVQSAAASAIIDAGDPAGLVAIRPSTGEVLAVVNVPGGFNRAFEGQYAPGSSFKIVTYSALLDNGLSADATMNCPEEYDPGGWTFVNAGGAEYGDQSVTEAFATSCNTALVHEIGQRLSADNLQASAEQFGMNSPLDLGVNTLEPSFPVAEGVVMMGAQGIGQGQVLTSPLHMATVPSAIADGSWRHPVLVTEPAREDLPEPNPIANAEAIRPMMRAVITEGTAKDAGFQGEVYGKTGSAEYGTPDEDDELPTHAWMVGYKGDVAFAIVVEGGGGGGSVAGPLAAKFTNAL
ncbi:penicillin-binding transpeptidase domain-containing protein [Nocardiopsis valliformis]|uniref:penicillin-binding transpeptidase domain-containing protein n=1 Tax=Nocardiopsis valliformis TaxID=239974 RepID=UPI0003467BFD|nr:penicillin-binding transpeptidase domain-containing protein [Nocardiopsis valliformis]